MGFGNKLYFAGSYTPDGFCSEIRRLAASGGIFTYIIKGAPGTGKSSVIRQIATEFCDEKGMTVYTSPYAPDCPEAVYFPEMSLLIANGSEPYLLEPEYRSVRQKVINLDMFLENLGLVEISEEIIRTLDSCRELRERCVNYTKALSSICGDTLSIADGCLLRMKLRAFAERFVRKLKLPKLSHKNEMGIRYFEQLSALTPNGYRTLFQTTDGYPTKIILQDSFYAATDVFLRIVTELLNRAGYDTQISRCKVFDEQVYEHLLVPEIGLAFLSANPLTGTLSANDRRPVNMLRFYDDEKLHAKKKRLRMNRNTADFLQSECAAAIAEELSARQSVADFYTQSMDFDPVDAMVSNIKIQMHIYRQLRGTAEDFMCETPDEDDLP